MTNRFECDIIGDEINFMLPTIIILALIVCWAVFVIIRRVRRAKRGIYCDCCSGGCNCECNKKIDDKKEE